MFILTDGNNYIQMSEYGGQYNKTGVRENARCFDTKDKAANVLRSLPKTMMGREKFSIIEIKTLVYKQCYNMEEVNTIKDMITALEKEVSDVISREDEYKMRLRDIDLELTDIDHYLEFYKLNACDGYKKAKLRQDKLKEKRRIKNILDEIQILKDLDLSDIPQRLENMINKKYTPRRLTDIFV